METKQTDISAVTAKNIKIGLVEKDLSRNALAAKAGIASTTFTRKLNSCGDFTASELGRIAEALDLSFVDLIKDAA